MSWKGGSDPSLTESRKYDGYSCTFLSAGIIEQATQKIADLQILQVRKCVGRLIQNDVDCLKP